MSQAAAFADAIRSRFTTEFAIPNALPVRYDNVPTENEPSTGRRASISIQLGQSSQVSVAGAGGRRWRTVGVALVQLFEPLGVGEGALLQLFGALQDAFRNVSIADPQIRFQSVSMVAPMLVENGHFTATAAVEFLADEFN